MEKYLNLFRTNKSLINYFNDEVVLYILTQDGFKNIKYIKNPSRDLLEFLIKTIPATVEYMDNIDDDLKKLAIKTNPHLIKRIKNPSEELKELAIRGDYRIIGSLDKPSYRLKNLALSLGPNAIRYIKKTNEKNQIRIIESDTKLISYIENPTQKVQDMVLDRDLNYIKMIKNPSHETIIRYIKEIELDSVLSYNSIDIVKGIEYHEIEDVISDDFRKLKFIENIDTETQISLLYNFGIDVVPYINNPSDEFLIEAINIGFIRVDLLKDYDIIYFLRNNISKLDNSILEEIFNLNIFCDEILEAMSDLKEVKKEIMKRKLKNR